METESRCIVQRWARGGGVLMDIRFLLELAVTVA